ncbi:MAG: hypothetical protein IPG66_18435 [Hydrogenophilales bacterium]|nr:hypothetical protein [Hydrogenophilales bacterium]
MTTLHHFTLSLTLTAPFLTQSSGAAAFGLDAAVARDHLGRPILPNTLVVGNLSHAWQSMHALGVAEAEDCLTWLGTGSGDDAGHFEPMRKSLHIDDLVGSDPSGDHTLQRIRVDREHSAVDKGALMIAEQPWAPGSELTFTGKVRFFGHADEAQRLTHALRAALHWAGQLGAERGVGFGAIKQTQFDKVAAPAANTAIQAPTAHGAQLPFALAFEHPFCLAERNLDNNLFASSEVIPGGALKGALADAWAHLLGKKAGSPIEAGFDSARPALSQHYTDILFRHAIPGTAKQAANVPPCSLVKIGDGQFRDIAALEEPGLINGQAPEFAVDWKGKDHAKVRHHFGWPNLERDLRVRTAIDIATGRAKKAQLFAYESIVPDGSVRWHGAILLDRVDKADQDRVMAELVSLLADLGHEIGPLGKTKAFARLEAVTSAIAEAQPRNDGLWIVTLQTPALLGDWRELDEAAGAEDMEALYRCYFSEASDGALELVRDYARQRLAGGKYLHNRFRKGKPYTPWLLTEAGSVFVLKANNGDSQACVESWLSKHLPTPDWLLAEASSAPAWRAIPYLPEGGYGQIAVNLPCHDGKPLAIDNE